jgi:hypothetical protein
MLHDGHQRVSAAVGDITQACSTYCSCMYLLQVLKAGFESLSLILQGWHDVVPAQ